MLKKFSKFIKNKKGDFAIFAVIIIPAFLTVFTGILSVSYRSNAVKSKIQTSVDNIALVASKYYASKVTSGSNACYFSSNIFETGRVDAEEQTVEISSASVVEKKDTFEYLFSEYIRTIDGYNSTWCGSITIVHDNNGAEILRLTIYYTFPKISNNMSVISSYGTAQGSNSSEWTGWYGANKETWGQLSSIILENFNQYGTKDWNKIDDGSVIAGYVTSETSCS